MAQMTIFSVTLVMLFIMRLGTSSASPPPQLVRAALDDANASYPFWGDSWRFNFVRVEETTGVFTSGVEYFSGARSMVRRDSSSVNATRVVYVDQRETQEAVFSIGLGVSSCTAQVTHRERVTARFMANTAYQGSGEFGGQQVDVFSGSGNDRFGAPVEAHHSQLFEVYVSLEEALPVGLKTSQYTLHVVSWESAPEFPAGMFALPQGCPRIEGASLMGLIFVAIVVVVLYLSIILVKK